MILERIIRWTDKDGEQIMWSSVLKLQTVIYLALIADMGIKLRDVTVSYYIGEEEVTEQADKYLCRNYHAWADEKSDEDIEP